MWALATFSLAVGCGKVFVVFVYLSGFWAFVLHRVYKIAVRNDCFNLVSIALLITIFFWTKTSVLLEMGLPQPTPFMQFSWFVVFETNEP